MKHIMVAVDGSEASARALRVAADIAVRFGAQLTLVHVLPTLPLPVERYGPAGLDVQRGHKAFAEELLTQASVRLGEPGLSIRKLVVDGKPAEAIAAAVIAEGADMVAIGSRGFGSVSRMLLGSVSDRLVHICEKPVIVVR